MLASRDEGIPSWKILEEVHGEWGILTLRRGDAEEEWGDAERWRGMEKEAVSLFLCFLVVGPGEFVKRTDCGCIGVQGCPSSRWVLQFNPWAIW